MVVVDFVKFVAMLLIAGTMIRFIELRWPESGIGKALGVVYG